MAVKLRLKRIGRRHQPAYRLSAVDSRSPRDGRVIEELGFYNPLARSADQSLKIKADRVEYWLSVGAQPTDTVRALLKRSGLNVQTRPRPTHPPKAASAQQDRPEEAPPEQAG